MDWRILGVRYAPMHAGAFVERLAATSFGDAFNSYREGDGAELRRARLRAYLQAQRAAPLLLVGEAPGYRGACVSGIPFTSERQMTGRSPTEATATIVHRVLAELDLHERVLLWNVVPAHPHLPGRPDTNRAPTKLEVAAGLPFVQLLAQGRRAIAIGQVAGSALDIPAIRHPSRGGATAFRDGLLQSALGGRPVRPFSVRP